REERDADHRHEAEHPAADAKEREELADRDAGERAGPERHEIARRGGVRAQDGHALEAGDDDEPVEEPGDGGLARAHRNASRWKPPSACVNAVKLPGGGRATLARISATATA